MKFSELSREQKEDVKQRLLCERLEEEGRTPSWGELADADTTISDEECEKAFAGTDFVPEDFSSEPEEEHRLYAAQVLTGLAKWVEQALVDAEYAKAKDRYMPIHHDESCGIAWAREKILAHIRELVP